MASYKLTIEVEADSESDMWAMLSDATMAAQNSFNGDYWGWTQSGWSIEIECEDGEEEIEIRGEEE